VHELSEDQHPGVCFERRLLAWVVSIYAFDEPDGSNLFEIGSIEVGANEAPGGSYAEISILFDEALAVLAAPVTLPKF
jgi:hypothetical protein